MSYDADDPHNLLGGRSRGQSTQLPGGPFRASGLLRGTLGDVRTGILPNKPVQLIDVEYDLPKVLLVQGSILPRGPSNAGNATSANWTIRTGLDRSPLRDRVIPATGRFSLTVIARSLSVVASAIDSTAGGFPPPYELQALVTPMDVSADAGFLSALSADAGLNGTASSAGESPNSSWTVSAPQVPILFAPNTLDSLLDAQIADPLLYGRKTRRGYSAFNNTAVDMFILHGARGVATSAAAFTVKLVPGAYYEAPYIYSGSVTYWFAAAGAGEAYFSAYGAAP